MASDQAVGRKETILRVLIADGRSSIRQELKEVLAKVEGVQVVGEARNGSEAVELAKRLRSDVVLMAQNIPGVSADSATRRIKAKQPKTRVWILADGEVGRDEAVGAGVDGYFVNGGSHRDLIEAFKKLYAYRQLPGLMSPDVKPPQLEWGAKRLWTTIAIILGLVLLASLIIFPRISLPTIALICGFFFLIYGLKYYGSVALILLATSGSPNGNGNGNGLNGVFNGMGITNGLKNRHDLEKPGLLRSLVGRILGWDPNGESKGMGNAQRDNLSNGRSLKNGNGYHFRGSEQPFISIHLPLYNETRVVDRLLEACTRLDYQNYEVLVADDSTDETIHHLEKWAKHPKVKVSHRINRTGFKGAALKHAMEVMDPRTRFIAVFDADFIPPPTILHQFLSYFFGVNGSNGNNHINGKNGDELDLIDESLAVVQGYQWHVLNASENWITRGVRTEFSGSYVVERPGQELTEGMKMISGSVFMIRADLLRDVGWGTSITEDWELTIRLYLEGYRVLYSPFIQAPAECVSDFKQLAKQRMRWAEGHTFNVKKYFLSILRSPKLTRREKLEFYYYVPYYLQSVFFITGTAAWFISEIFLRTHLPFWTATLGWSLVFTNTFALIFMNVAGLFLERGIRRNFAGLLSFVLLTFLLVPYQAYAALKGLLEPHEGGWHRTDKTGVITDVIDRLGLGKRMRRLAPKRKKSPRVDLEKRLGTLSTQISRHIPRPVRRALRPGNLSFRVLSGLVIGLVTLGILASNVQVGEAEVSGTSNIFYFYDDTTPLQYMMFQTQPNGSQTSTNSAITFYSDAFAADWDVAPGTTTVYFFATSGVDSCDISLTLKVGSTSLGSGTLSIPSFADDYYSASINTSSYTFSEGERLSLEVGAPCAGITLFWDGARNNARLEIPTLAIQDVTVLFMVLVVLIPVATGLFTRNRRAFVWLVTLGFSLLLTISLFVQQVMPASAEVSETTNIFYFYDDTTPEQYMMYQTQPSGTETSAGFTTVYFYSDTFPTDWLLSEGTTTIYVWGAHETLFPSINIPVELSYGSGSEWTSLGSGGVLVTDILSVYSGSFETSGHTFASGERLRLIFTVPFNTNIYWDGAYNASRMVTPSLTIPDVGLFLLFVVYLIPIVTGLMTRKSRLALRIISIAISIVVTLAILATQVYRVSAEVSETTNTFYFYGDTTPEQYMMYQSQPSGSETSWSDTTTNFYSDTFPADWQVNGGTSTVYIVAEVIPIGASFTITLYAGSTGDWTQLGTNTQMQLQCSKQLITLTMSTSGYTFSSGERFWLTITTASGVTIYWDGASNNSRLVTPTIVMFEWGFLFLLLVPLFPYLSSIFWKRRRFAGQLMTIILAGCVTIGLLATQVQTAGAAPYYDIGSSNVFWFYDDTSPYTYMMYQSQPSGSSTTSSSTEYFYSDTIPAGTTMNAGTSTFYMSAANSHKVQSYDITVTLEYGSGSTWTSLGSWILTVPANATCGATPYSASHSTSGHLFASGELLRLTADPSSSKITMCWDGSYNNSRLVTPDIVVPEGAVAFVIVVVMIPMLTRTLKRRKALRLSKMMHRPMKTGYQKVRKRRSVGSSGVPMPKADRHV